MRRPCADPHNAERTLERKIGTVMAHRNRSMEFFLNHMVFDKLKAVSASAGRGYQLSAVEAPFSSAGWAATPQMSPSAVRLLYDSFAQPLPTGTRSAGVHVRQMLFRTEHHQIDIQVEARLGANRL